MKTTVEISDALLDDAKRVANADKTTLRALIEEGLRRVVADRRDARGFSLRDEAFRGKGLHPDAVNQSWDAIRDQIYEGRGA
jgi:hypothetical protein